MPVTFGELSTLTTPLSVVRLCALLFSCLTFSLASYSSQDNAGDLYYLTIFKSFCMVTWCLFFVLTFLVMVIHFIQFHNLLPLSWKNLTATIAALGALMTFFASFAFTWTLVIHQSQTESDPKSIAAAVGSYLTSLAYSEELHLIRSQSDGQQRGYMATVPGLLKVLQVFGGCIALLLSIQTEPQWRICVSAVTYSMCLLPTVGTVLVMVMDCAAQSPVPFDRLLASFSLLGVVMYTVNTVICFTQILDQHSTRRNQVVIMSETVIACITLLAYTVDLAFSVKLLCDRN